MEMEKDRDKGSIPLSAEHSPLLGGCTVSPMKVMQV